MSFGIFLLFSLTLSAQPAFEVATIKPRDIFQQNGRKFGLSLSGSHISLIGYTLSSLIVEAYGVESYQVSRGPAWANDSVNGVFEIDAKAEGESAPSKEQFHQMLQALLADRFKLQLHREQKDLPVYDLVIAKRGVKLKESPADAVFSNRQGSSGQGISMVAVHQTMAQLANMIKPYTGRPVLDKTGLTQTYDFKLEFTSAGPRGPGAADASDTAAPSIFIALEQQLGLKLDSQKKPVEILIIDRAEKPSEN